MKNSIMIEVGYIYLVKVDNNGMYSAWSVLLKATLHGHVGLISHGLYVKRWPLIISLF